MHPFPEDRLEYRIIAPGEHPHWEEALALVNRDLAVTLPELRPLLLVAPPQYEPDEPEQVYVALSDGLWWGNHLHEESAPEPGAALAAVAEAAQDTITECLWRAWPLCGEHGLGMHPRDDADGVLSWWCAGDRAGGTTGYLRAPVGALDTLVRPHRPNRARRRGN
ncbi:hypothetical protein [Streptomyces sp. CAU 1734]|uniref:hypothetical protein n=1 Tax=Streptomyces sp. CAU 1734 TaxID=3140360 RepID=UPI0032619295